MFADHPEKILAHAPSHTQLSPVTDHCSHMDKSIIRVTVSNAIVVATLRARSQPTKRKNARLRSSFVELIQKSGQVHLVLYVARIFYYQVGH